MATSETQTAWLAGLLEGEGSFLVQKRGGNRRDQARVYIAMTDEDVVRRAADLMGGSVQKRTRREAHWKDQWTTVVTGQRAADVMQAVLPYLGQRRAERVRAILAMPLSHTTVE